MTDYRSAAEYLGRKDYDIIDDYIYDDDLGGHRQEIMNKMMLAVNEIEDAAIKIAIDLYYEAVKEFQPDQRPSCKSFDLRFSDLHAHLDDALKELWRAGFFADSASQDKEAAE